MTPAAVARSFVGRPLRAAKARGRNQVQRLADFLRGETDATFFPLRDLPRLNAFLAARGFDPLTPDPGQAEVGVTGATRFLLALVAGNPGIRRRFTRPLSDGPAGGFGRWVAAAGAADLGLSPAGVANVRAAFAAEPGVRVRRIFELREDLRGVFPLGLTPKQRGDYLGWLLSFGRDDFRVSPESALWFLLELDEDPAAGLTASYRVHPAWQAAVPHGLTRFGWADLKKYVAETHGVDCRWLRRAALPEQFGPWDELHFLFAARPETAAGFPETAAMNRDPAPVVRWAARLPGVDADWLARLGAEVAAGRPAELGVNVIGLFRYTSGLQQAVRGTVEALRRCGVRTALRDYPVLFLREPRDKTPYDSLEPHDVTVLNIGLDTPVPEAYRKTGLHPRAGVRRVGIWWWEMEQLPADWLSRGDHVDEIWAPTRFIADAMSRAFAKPVFPMLPGMELSPFDRLPKEYFGFNPRKFTFAFMFDMNSRMERKNPLGLIRAFRRAFTPDEPVELVIKVSPPESYYKEQWEDLRRAAARAGVTLLERVYTRSELLAFLSAADAYVSLHRSEGFGLTCAEAMLLGKPVVATGYSGNLDFMTPRNSYLVDYARVTLAEDIDPYPRGAAWANPDVDHAAQLMRRVVANPAEAREKSGCAAIELKELLSVDAAGRRMTARLRQIRRETRG